VYKLEDKRRFNHELLLGGREWDNLRISRIEGRRKFLSYYDF